MEGCAALPERGAVLFRGEMGGFGHEHVDVGTDGCDVLEGGADGRRAGGGGAEVTWEYC